MLLSANFLSLDTHNFIIWVGKKITAKIFFVKKKLLFGEHQNYEVGLDVNIDKTYN
jgi:hypothetical protein